MVIFGIFAYIGMLVLFLLYFVVKRYGDKNAETYGDLNEERNQERNEIQW